MKRQIIWIHWDNPEFFPSMSDNQPGVVEMDRDILEEFRLNQDPLTLERSDLSLFDIASQIAPIPIELSEFSDRAKAIRHMGDMAITIWTPNSQIHNYEADALLRDFFTRDAPTETLPDAFDDDTPPALFDWFNRGRLPTRLN